MIRTNELPFLQYFAKTEIPLYLKSGIINNSFLSPKSNVLESNMRHSCNLCRYLLPDNGWCHPTEGLLFGTDRRLPWTNPCLLERCAWPYYAKALVPILKRGLGFFSSSRKRDKEIAALKPFIFQGEIPFEPGVWNRIMDRVDIWSAPPNPLEWSGTLISRPKVDRNEAIAPITDFVEMPIWQLSRSHGLSFLIDDVVRIAQKMFVVGSLHSHPDGDLLPSSSDWATFTYLDAILGRPLLYMIVSPDRKRKPLIIHFETCYRCPNSFLRILDEIRKNGGE